MSLSDELWPHIGGSTDIPSLQPMGGLEMEGAAR